MHDNRWLYNYEDISKKKEQKKNFNELFFFSSKNLILLGFLFRSGCLVGMNVY